MNGKCFSGNRPNYSNWNLLCDFGIFGLLRNYLVESKKVILLPLREVGAWATMIVNCLKEKVLGV
jgi:hypothetical protein